ncbi:MAG: type I 3-dehydroquinate dehydratase [Vicinamibacterales bacterium]
MPRPLLCETVTGSTIAELRAARDAASGVDGAGADMVELRLDGVADLDVAGALAGRTTPVVVTCRPTWEGGRFDGAEETRRRVLAEALALGAEFVDVEWRAGWDDLIASTGGRRIVVSNHDFAGVPWDLADRHRAMRATGAEVVKLASAVTRVNDTLAFRPLAADGASIVIGMGPAGVATRLLAAHFGSRWTYAGHSGAAGYGVAPGQIPAGEMIGRFRFKEITAQTAVYGVVGKPILHSLSPAMHNAAFRAAGLDAVYVPVEADDADDFLTFAAGLPMAGASVTTPFKRDVMVRAAAVDADARAVGAVNTVRRSGTGWDATNTDVAGFLAPLERRATRAGWRLQGSRVAVLGAGGAARAVVRGAAGAGAQVTIHARRREQAQSVADGLGASVGTWPPPAGSWDVLVNCTPLGNLHTAGESPLPDGPFGGRLVYDLIYVPRETRLLREARAAGCDTLDGLPMLVAQAERQFEWWTGRRPAPGVMGQAAGLMDEDA